MPPFSVVDSGTETNLDSELIIDFSRALNVPEFLLEAKYTCFSAIGVPVLSVSSFAPEVSASPSLDSKCEMTEKMTMRPMAHWW